MNQSEAIAISHEVESSILDYCGNNTEKLAREGLTEEAWEMIRNLPMQPGSSVPLLLAALGGAIGASREVESIDGCFCGACLDVAVASESASLAGWFLDPLTRLSPASIARWHGEEAMRKNLLRYPRGLLFQADAADSWLAKPTGKNALEQKRMAKRGWERDTFNWHDRKRGWEPHIGRNMTITCVWTVAQQVFPKLFTEEDFMAGYHSRWLFSFPETASAPSKESRWLLGVTRRLLSLEMEADERGNLSPVRLGLAKDAYEALQLECDRLRNACPPDQDTKASLIRLREGAFHMALILRLLRWAESGEEKGPGTDDSVELMDMMRAISLMRLCAGSLARALRVFGRAC